MPNAHTGSDPAALSSLVSRSAPAVSQPGRCAGSSGNRPSGTLRNGMDSADRVRTISATQRCTRPTCVASWRSVQSGQLGTGWVRSSRPISAASVAVLAVISASSVAGLRLAELVTPCWLTVLAYRGGLSRSRRRHRSSRHRQIAVRSAAPARPPTETVDSSLTVSSCPCGHGHGSD